MIVGFMKFSLTVNEDWEYAMSEYLLFSDEEESGVAVQPSAGGGGRGLGSGVEPEWAQIMRERAWGRADTIRVATGIFLKIPHN